MSQLHTSVKTKQNKLKTNFMGDVLKQLLKGSQHFTSLRAKTFQNL